MAGTYTDIVSITAPGSALAGSRVSVEVRVKNLHSAAVHIYCIAVLDSAQRFIDWQEAWVNPGVTKTFAGSFTMPSSNVTINAYTYYQAADGYVYSDDQASKSVSLEQVKLVAEFSSFRIVNYKAV